MLFYYRFYQFSFKNATQHPSAVVICEIDVDQ